MVYSNCQTCKYSSTGVKCLSCKKGYGNFVKASSTDTEGTCVLDSTCYTSISEVVGTNVAKCESCPIKFKVETETCVGCVTDCYLCDADKTKC
jgi:hypothetical protein